VRAAQARSQAAKYTIPTLFDIEKVADGVYAAIARPTAFINCNAAIFEGASDIVVVDTHGSTTAAVSLVSQLRREVTSKPVRYIVNTHFHGDHVQGTPTYKRIAPLADVVASEATRKKLAEDNGRGLQRSLEQAKTTLESHKKKAAEAKTPEEKAYWQKMAQETASFIGEMKLYAPELPNVTFVNDLIVHDKAHDLHFAFRGRGHTNGDIVVFCPQKKVLAAGDLLHSFSPTITDGYPKEWPKTLDSLARFEFESVIGGHGSVHRNRQRLGDMRAYLAELAEVVEREKRQGKKLEDVQKSVTPASLKSLANGYGRFFAEQRFKGSPQPPGRTVDDVLAEAVKINVGHVYANLERG
jgi:glyoxylase-like metal-dependent hydrolase (beta-lactamase superfamily II)